MAALAFIRIAAIGLASFLLPAQTGVENAWDVRTILTGLNKDNADLKSLFDGLKPQQWVDQKGAPSTYILVWQTAERQLQDVTTVVNQLARKTDSLSLAIDSYFRFDALDVTARSLEEGAQKYGDRPTAEKLSALLARNFNDRERLRDYIRDLTANVEQNFKVADEEAQRCRGMISKEPQPPSKKTKR